MATGIGSAATRKVMDRLAGPAEAGALVGALVEAGFQEAGMRAQNAAAEAAERAGTMKYPLVTVYCERVVNELREKFRSFSGKVEMAIEVRHSQDGLEGIEEALERQTDAVTSALTAGRGDWGDGMHYAGGYQVTFGRAGRGGKNYTQVAKVTFEIGVSRN